MYTVVCLRAFRTYHPVTFFASSRSAAHRTNIFMTIIALTEFIAFGTNFHLTRVAETDGLIANLARVAYRYFTSATHIFYHGGNIIFNRAQFARYCDGGGRVGGIRTGHWFRLRTFGIMRINQFSRTISYPRTGVFSYTPQNISAQCTMNRVVADMIRDKFMKACVAHYRDDVVRLYDGRMKIARRMGFRMTYQRT